MNEFSKKQAAEATGLSLRAIQYYTERGVVSPDVDEGAGKGSKRLYSKQNLVELSIIKALSEYQIAFPIVKTVMDLLRTPLPYKKEDKEMKVHSGGILEIWEQIESSAYIELFKREKGFLPMFSVKKKGDDFTINPQWLDMSDSVLIIDFEKIVRRIREL